MRIISLQAENFMKLRAIRIDPKGNVVVIGGPNGSGKSSTLNSIHVALMGLAVSPAVPIREGQERAVIRLDLGDIVVTRTFRKAKDGEYTSQLTVEGADGARYPSPQSMLDSLLGALSFDPLAFSRMAPRDQFDTLRKFVPGVDFDAIDAAQKADYDKRTEVNRRAKESRAAAQAIPVSEEGPTDFVDDKDLVDQMAEAAAANAKIESRKQKRAAAAETVTDNRATAEKARKDADDRASELVKDAEVRGSSLVKDASDSVARAQEALARAQASLDTAKTGAKTALAEANKKAEAVIGQADVDCKALLDEAAELEQALKDAEPLPPPTDVAAIRAKLDGSRQANEEVRQRRQRKEYLAKAVVLESESGQVTKEMERRAADKAAKIAAAKLPVAGLGFGDGAVLMNGLPFSQASDAEQLRTSIAVAMALNPKLRVIRVRDGSLLDEKSMALLESMAKDQDMQVWVERVGSGGVGFVMEDGAVQGQTAPGPAASEVKDAAKAPDRNVAPPTTARKPRPKF